MALVLRYFLAGASLFVARSAAADSEPILFVGAGAGAAVEATSPRWLLTGRLQAGGGFVGRENGGGLMLECGLLVQTGRGRPFLNGLRLEGGVRILTPKGGFRLFGGGLIRGSGGHGGLAYGLPFAIKSRALITPELGAMIARQADGSLSFIVSLQVLGDWLFGLSARD